jgi:preprotein translocase subunit SecE
VLLSPFSKPLSKTISYSDSCVFCFQNFLRDLLKEAKKINDVSEDKLIEYTDTMVTIQFLMTFIVFFIGLYVLRTFNIHMATQCCTLFCANEALEEDSLRYDSSIL